MKLDFRIDWGYQYLYSRRHYHPTYLWDGHLECSGGAVNSIHSLAYPVIWFGPGHCAEETLLDGCSWSSTTKRGLSGIRVEADVEEGGLFRLVTLSGTFEFSAAELIEKGRIVFPVGPKYLGCNVIVTRKDYYWFLPAPLGGEQVFAADDFADSVPVRDWARMRTAWIAPGEAMTFSADILPGKAEFMESILHIVCMAAPEYTPGAEKQVHDDFPVRLLCDGVQVAGTVRYLREHDVFMQMLEDIWLRFQAAPGRHEFQLCNDNPRYHLLVTRMTIRNSEHNHLDFSLPSWALVNEELIGRIFALREDRVTVDWGEGSTTLDLVPGWNDFRFSFSRGGSGKVVTAGTSSGVIPAVYDLADEIPEVTVGYDMTVVPHDDTGVMDWLLDYTWRTRLGNLVVFRNFRPNTPAPAAGNQTDKIKDIFASQFNPSAQNGPLTDDTLERWGNFCRTHHIYVEAANCYASGALVRSAGEMLHSVGPHEYPGAVYALDPSMQWRSEDMKQASENFLRYLKKSIDEVHKVSPRAAFGDASGGHRYCYRAGVDFIRTETMVPHTQHLCSQARPAAEALGSGEWGVHIAIQHPYQPYQENHLGQYFLSLFQPWMMGASMIYEEDSLFELFKEERQAWDDLLTKGKRDMTRDFYKFVKTHPRRGKVTRPIAFVEGRYAAPFNGFICDTDQTPDYSVWGLFGKVDPLWGHRQPEKCRQLLDVLMPGASTQPLRQDYTRRRFFFSGTPFGDFDEVPTEASGEYLAQYRLLLHLGWNTMIQEDYDKMLHFVEEGGTLLIGLPQFSRHTRRDFLAEMLDLDLWTDGDLTELCGLSVSGPGTLYSGTWNCADLEEMKGVIPRLSAIPSHHPEEDGPCRTAKLKLAGAEPYIWDAATGQPLVTRFRKGRGQVYLITAFAYPGHEALQEVVSTLMVQLAGEHLPQNHVEDPSREVFWNQWDEGNGMQRVMMLNTDWTTAGNTRQVTLHTGFGKFPVTVREREAKILTICRNMVLEPDDASIHLEMKDGTLTAHGEGIHTLAIRTAESTRTVTLDFKDQTRLPVIPE